MFCTNSRRLMLSCQELTKPTLPAFLQYIPNFKFIRSRQVYVKIKVHNALPQNVKVLTYDTKESQQ